MALLNDVCVDKAPELLNTDLADFECEGKPASA